MAKAKNALAFGVRWSALLSVSSCFPPQETAHAKSYEFMSCSATNSAKKSSSNLLALRSLVRDSSIVIIFSLAIPLKSSLFFGRPSISLCKNFLSQCSRPISCISVKRFCSLQPTKDRSNYFDSKQEHIKQKKDINHKLRPKPQQKFGKVAFWFISTFHKITTTPFFYRVSSSERRFLASECICGVRLTLVKYCVLEIPEFLVPAVQNVATGLQ